MKKMNHEIINGMCLCGEKITPEKEKEMEEGVKKHLKKYYPKFYKKLYGKAKKSSLDNSSRGEDSL